MTHDEKLLGQRDWRKRNRKKVSQYNKQNSKRWLKRYRNNYGMSEADFAAMLISQCGRCAICKDPLIKRFALDHDHKTGKVREILCWYCNVMLGQAKDQASILIRGAEYLEKHKPQ